LTTGLGTVSAVGSNQREDLPSLKERLGVIRVVNVSLEGRYGGPQARIAAVARSLKKYGVETIVFLPRRDSDIFRQKLEEKEVTFRLLDLHHLSRKKSEILRMLVSFIPETLGLAKALRIEKIEIVHCNGAWQWQGIIAGKLSGAKVIWHLNDTLMPFLVRLVFRILSYLFCDGFVVAGERVRKTYLETMRPKAKPVIEIQAPVDTSVFDPKKLLPDVRVSSFPGMKVITVGNLNPLKGIEFFIRMAKIVGERHRDISFLIGGQSLSSQQAYEGMLRNLVQRLGLKNLHFLGRVDDVPSFLKAGDIYVCSSISEASPVSVWEAMSMAKAIVSTDVGDVSRFIRDGENGFVVPIENAEALAEKVDELITSGGIREVFGKKAREIALRYLNVDTCVERHAAFYKRILKGKSASAF
jgi:glycosyltransferase involved in cell wall biosynthesis